MPAPNPKAWFTRAYWTRDTLIRWVKNALLLVVFAFIGRFLYRNFDSIRNAEFVFNLPVFLISMLFIFAYKVMLASLWHMLTRELSCQISYTKALIAYFYSILGKFIPGKVFMLGARLYYYRAEGRNLKNVTLCFFIENLLTLLAAALLFLLSLFFMPDTFHPELLKYRPLAILLILLFLVVIHPKVINMVLRVLEKFMKRKDLQISLSYGSMLKFVGLFVVNWLVMGAGFYMLTCSIFPLPFSQMPYVSGVYALAAIIGILSLFAPSGIGVRDAMIVAGLGMLMPASLATIISVLGRLWSTIPELVLPLLSFVYAKARGISYDRNAILETQAEAKKAKGK